MIAVMNVPKMDEAPASAAAAAEAVPEHMGALSVGNDYGYGKVEDVREQHAKELQRDKKNDEAKAEAAAAKAPLEAAPEALAKEQWMVATKGLATEKVSLLKNPYAYGEGLIGGYVGK